MNQKQFRTRVDKLEQFTAELCDQEPDNMIAVLSETYLRVTCNVKVAMDKVTDPNVIKKGLTDHFDLFVKTNPQMFR